MCDNLPVARRPPECGSKMFHSIISNCSYGDGPVCKRNKANCGFVVLANWNDFHINPHRYQQVENSVLPSTMVQRNANNSGDGSIYDPHLGLEKLGYCYTAASKSGHRQHSYCFSECISPTCSPVCYGCTL